MIYLKLLLLALITALLYSCFLALGTPMGQSFYMIISDPWGLVALMDLYAGFILICILIIFFEKSLTKKLLWGIAIFCLGNIASALWLFFNIRAMDKRLRNCPDEKEILSSKMKMP